MNSLRHILLSTLLLSRILKADPESPALTIRSVLPSLTDKRIDRYSGDGWEHWIYLSTTATARGQLFVFIPGTGGKGNGAKGLCSLAASEGYHVVSLAYPSEVSMSVFRQSEDVDAFQKARENLIEGKVPFQQLDTGAVNCIHNRLQRLLTHLAATYPKENWQQFLQKDGTMDYRKMALAGQSQGGGHAALMGIQHEVARVVMFGSPKDFNLYYNQPAKWMTLPSATPLNRFFSFVHSADEGHGCTYAQQLENYRALKLSPRYPVVDVDNNSAPFQHSRLLTSHADTTNPHTSVVGLETYRPVWKYLLVEPVE